MLPGTLTTHIISGAGFTISSDFSCRTANFYEARLQGLIAKNERHITVVFTVSFFLSPHKEANLGSEGACQVPVQKQYQKVST